MGDGGSRLQVKKSGVTGVQELQNETAAFGLPRKRKPLPLRFEGAAFAYVAREPTSLFELRRVRKAGKGRAIAKRRRIPLPEPALQIAFLNIHPRGVAKRHQVRQAKHG